MRLLRNIKKWWPILKEDEDWDYYYLLKVINFKLDKMEEYLRKHGHSENSGEVADEMGEASYYLKQLIEDDFYDHAKMDAKWGETKFNFHKDGELTFDVPNVKTAEDEAQYSKDILAEYANENKRMQAALGKFCQIFNTKLFGW